MTDDYEHPTNDYPSARPLTRTESASYVRMLRGWLQTEHGARAPQQRTRPPLEQRPSHTARTRTRKDPRR